MKCDTPGLFLLDLFSRWIRGEAAEEVHGLLLALSPSQM